VKTIIPESVQREINHICREYKRRIHRGDLEKIARMTIRETMKPRVVPFTMASGMMGTELGDWIISENIKRYGS
jgi:hypothetical protein